MGRYIDNERSMNREYDSKNKNKINTCTYEKCSKSSWKESTICIKVSISKEKYGKYYINSYSNNSSKSGFINHSKISEIEKSPGYS
jgi:hypothetical protein